MTTKAGHRLTLRDRLSRLNFELACKLLGPGGKKLIVAGGKWEIDLQEQVYLKGDLYRVRFDDAVVSMTLTADRRERLNWNCTACENVCEHVGAAFALVLEEKMALGLAVAPPERVVVDSLAEDKLISQALAERELRAREEKFAFTTADSAIPWTDYSLTSKASGKTYRVALRGTDRGVSYCSCPDFKTNTLGTCKHVMHMLRRIKNKFPAQVRRKPYRRKNVSVYLANGRQGDLKLRFGIPHKLGEESAAILNPVADKDIDDVHALVRRIERLERNGEHVHVYPDAEEFIQQQLFQARMQTLVAEIRRDPAGHPLRTSLLKSPLLPYQMDGIAFAAGAGRAVLADDMGLGKTIQGVGVAELLAREAGLRKVLIVCPTSLKSQWRSEITRFSDRECQLILGSTSDRARQYDNEAFFTICNYEQVLRDLLSIERVKWDLIILDEGQRIKNWETKTSQLIKCLKSTYALVLSGTPLENRLDDLYSVVQFVDDRRLGPAFRFFNRHRMVDENGRVLGFQKLDQLRENLTPILLRRTREQVLSQLPERTTEIVRIAPTDEQLKLHAANMNVVVSIVRKPFISEMDLLRLRQALLACRMAADSTTLCDKRTPGFSTKLERLDELLQQLFAEDDRKVILFSEWTSMLSLIEKTLKRMKLHYVRLDGSIPQKKRAELVHEFQTNPECRLFITTNAGSVGLNLQAANTVINVDLPWNPAVLEQRIARAHRMGQKRPVQVYLLVTEQTIEESLLGTLAAKKDLALAALDMDSDVEEVHMKSGKEELCRRLEVLLGAKSEAALDVSQQMAVGEQVEQVGDQEAQSHGVPSNQQEPSATNSHEHAAPADAATRERVATAGGELLGAVFSFIGELVGQGAGGNGEVGVQSQPAPEIVESVRNRLHQCADFDAEGRPRLAFTLPNRAALDGLAATLARLLTPQK